MSQAPSKFSALAHPQLDWAKRYEADIEETPFSSIGQRPGSMWHFLLNVVFVLSQWTKLSEDLIFHTFDDPKIYLLRRKLVWRCAVEIQGCMESASG